MVMKVSRLQEQFGQIDIYLFDQLLKGRIRPGMHILDAGCGDGRNLIYFLREGYRVFAADAGPDRVEQVRRTAGKLAPSLPPSNFRAEPIEHMSFEKACADVVISSAVLHFAQDDAHFDAMLQGSLQMLKANGLFFCRLASSIGIEDQIVRIEGCRFRLPDGSERYLVDEALLGALTKRIGSLVDPLKTTIVQNQRAMTTWVVRKK